MSRAVLALLATLAALAQIGAVPAAFLDPLAGPTLPIALGAGWASVRDPRETWPLPLAAAVVLGAVSEARVGWFVLAFLPVIALTILFRQTEGRGLVTIARRLLTAGVAGLLGTVAYVVVLALGAGTLRAIPGEFAVIASGAAWTATLAMCLTSAMWPLRAQNVGLFA